MTWQQITCIHGVYYIYVNIIFRAYGSEYILITNRRQTNRRQADDRSLTSSSMDIRYVSRLDLKFRMPVIPWAEAGTQQNCCSTRTETLPPVENIFQISEQSWRTRVGVFQDLRGNLSSALQRLDINHPPVTALRRR